ncbi:hypothetical protein Staley_46 [Bacillus phage Staley]|uniref:Uncharacterized protein n=1 Tax=Bacillus phage Staley TaxID=1406792 RepID=U5PXT8_9CAUD|nr:hypothetical protein Staley_46 [Bacillus phage Staley]AGY48729.1 hypothetical protein Staley_46 [Bacillus phage Staley]
MLLLFLWRKNMRKMIFITVDRSYKEVQNECN